MLYINSLSRSDQNQDTSVMCKQTKIITMKVYKMVNFAVKCGCWSNTYHDLEHLSGRRSERALILLWNSDVSLLNLPQKVTCPGKNADCLFRGNYSRSVGAKSQRDRFNKSAVSCLHNPDDISLRCALKTTPTWTRCSLSYPESSPSPHISWFRWRSAAGTSWHSGWAETRGEAQVTASVWAGAKTITALHCP